MRKKTINSLFDNVFWYLVYMLPIILLVVFAIKNGTFVSFSEVMSSCHLDILTTNDLYVTLNSIFGSTGVVPLFSSPDVLMFMSYFIGCYLVHLCVDFLLFIPRIANSWLNKFYGEGGDK